MNLLIGSRALNYWFDSVKISDDTDWDVISPEPIEGCEWHDPNLLNNKDVANYASSELIELPNGSEARVVIPLGLALIKRSHLWRNLSFQKHITHYHKQLAPYRTWDYLDMGFLETRIALTKKQFPQGNPNLMQSKEDFFDDAVTKVYDHDYLHELVAYYDKPLYTRLLRDTSLAWCEQGKWVTLTDKDKALCVAEEVQVIAIERFMIPNNWQYPYKLAYMKALEKVCTTLCSGWFRDYAIDHYPVILELFDKTRMTNIKSILQKEQ